MLGHLTLDDYDALSEDAVINRQDIISMQYFIICDDKAGHKGYTDQCAKTGKLILGSGVLGPTL